MWSNPKMRFPQVLAAIVRITTHIIFIAKPQLTWVEKIKFEINLRVRIVDERTLSFCKEKQKQQNVTAPTMSMTLRWPYEKMMAFGGVATGNMKAYMHAMLPGIMRNRGFTFTASA